MITRTIFIAALTLCIVNKVYAEQPTAVKRSICILQTSDPVYNFVPTDESYNGRTVFRAVDDIGGVSLDMMIFSDGSRWNIAKNASGDESIGIVNFVDPSEECPADDAEVLNSQVKEKVYINRVHEQLPYTMCTPKAHTDFVFPFFAHHHGKGFKSYVDCARKAFKDRPAANYVAFNPKDSSCASYFVAIQIPEDGDYTSGGCFFHETALPGTAIGSSVSEEFKCQGMAAGVAHCRLNVPYANGVEMSKNTKSCKCVTNMVSVDTTKDKEARSVFFVPESALYPDKYPATTSTTSIPTTTIPPVTTVTTAPSTDTTTTTTATPKSGGGNSNTMIYGVAGGAGALAAIGLGLGLWSSKRRTTPAEVVDVQPLDASWSSYGQNSSYAQNNSHAPNSRYVQNSSYAFNPNQHSGFAPNYP